MKKEELIEKLKELPVGLEVYVPQLANQDEVYKKSEKVEVTELSDWDDEGKETVVIIIE